MKHILYMCICWFCYVSLNVSYITLLKSDATERNDNHCPVVTNSLTLTEVFTVIGFTTCYKKLQN
jgi:hypothetical protein